MPSRWICAHGHRWESDGSRSDQGALRPVLCPTCESPGARLADRREDDAGFVFPGSRPDLAGVRIDDQAVTIAASQSSAPIAPPNEQTIGPEPAGVAAALRTAVPGYEILEELGRGGMGVVYKARHVDLNRLVALKMVLAGVHIGAKELVRFQAEAAAVAGLHHPNIVQIFEVGEHEGRPYFSLEFVGGGSLALLLNGKPLPPPTAADLIARLARTIHYAHEKGIVHRDLKPANILLTIDGQPKITDFGLAKQLRAGAGLTQSGTVLGTPSYMAPEQALGKAREVGPAADIYALGAIFYEMLCGRPPFRSESSLDTMLQVASEEPAPLSRLQPKLPRDLVTICHKCLQKEPHKRYATAQAFAEDVERFVNSEPIQARPVGTIERAVKWARRRPAAAALVVLVALSSVFGFAGVVWRWRVEADLRQQAENSRTEAEEARRGLAEALALAEANLYGNRIALAEREWLANNIARARHLLAECPENMQKWEWHYLNRLCHADILTLRGHESTIFSIAFSPNELNLVSASADQTIKVWDASSGRVVFTQRGASNRDRSVAVGYHPEGRQIFCAAAGQRFIVRDFASGQEITSYPRPPGAVFSSAFSPDRKLLATGGLEGNVRVWEVGTDKEKTINAHGGAVQAVAFSPSSAFLATAGVDGVKVWELESGKEVQAFREHHSAVTALAFGPTGRRIASASRDGTIKVWDALTGKVLYNLRGHSNQVHCLVFHPKTLLLASAGRDQIVRVWNLATGEEVFTLRGHTKPITALAFNSSGRLLASAGEDQTVKIWDATTGQDARAVRAHLACQALTFSPDGQRLASAEDGVRVWEPGSGRLFRAFGGSAGLIRSAAFSPDGKVLATAGDDGVRLWDPLTGKGLGSLRGPNRRDRCLAYHPDGVLLASGGDGEKIYLWNLKTGEVHSLEGHSGPINGLAFSPDGKRIASAGADRTVRVWEVATGRQLLKLRDPGLEDSHSASIHCVAFHPGSQLLVTGGEARASEGTEAGADGELKVWDATTGDLLHTLWGHSGAINVVAFTPDGSRLASGSEDQTIKFWEPVLGLEILTLRGHSSSVLGLAFSPDGSFLASTSMDQTLRLWNASPLQ